MKSPQGSDKPTQRSHLPWFIENVNKWEAWKRNIHRTCRELPSRPKNNFNSSETCKTTENETLSINQEVGEALPVENKSSLWRFSSSIGISMTTLHVAKKRGQIARISITMHPVLTDENKNESFSSLFCFFILCQGLLLLTVHIEPSNLCRNMCILMNTGLFDRSEQVLLRYYKWKSSIPLFKSRRFISKSCF